MKSIWAIVIGLRAMLILSFVMVFITLAHPPLPTKTRASHTSARVPCNCNGRCMR